jgi:dihydroxy-acid dehydratase
LGFEFRILFKVNIYFDGWLTIMDEKSKGYANRLTEYGDREFSLYIRRTFASSMGFSNETLDKPIIGIVNTFSELNNCHRGFKELVEAVKRGVSAAGGLPLEFPVISLGEVFLSPTSMMLRNLMSMDVEAMLKAQPLDAVVLMGGCDKTLPALLMGAASAGLPAIVLAAGPMLAGDFEGETVGACTDCRRFWAQYRRGEIDEATVQGVQPQLVPTAGTCGVMGTASTMACLTEALGMMLPGGAAIPAVYAERLRHGELTGQQAVQLSTERITPDQIMTEEAFDNALRVLLAIGGSTNAIIHLTAIAGRLGIQIDLERLNTLSDDTPVLVALKPTGQYYMEDFYRAGGLPVVLQALKEKLHLNVLTVTGQTIGEWLEDDYQFPDWQNIISPIHEPLQPVGALIALKGNLAPDGAILKRSAASPHLLNTTGRAVVFSSLEDLAKRMDDPELDVKPDDFLVLQNAGPIGAPGMPEAGYLPIPKKLTGVKDMVRLSDARMSGTAFGTIVLHISPESAVGGVLGLVQSGDMIELSADKRQINLLVDDEELDRRRQAHPIQLPHVARGYEHLFQETVQQAHLGMDFDFLRHELL